MATPNERSYTHNSMNGTDTVYISDKAQLKSSTGTSFTIVNKDLAEFFFQINGTVYEKGEHHNYQKWQCSNHLFISLNLAWERESRLEHEQFILQYDDVGGETGSEAGSDVGGEAGGDAGAASFSFHSFKQPSNGPLANFASYWCNGRAEEKNLRIGSEDWSARYVKNHNESCGEGTITTHSECSVFYYFTETKPCILDRILERIKGNGRPERLLRVVQVGLHSFNDFCTACNKLVYTKQEGTAFKIELRIALSLQQILFSSLRVQ